MAKTFKTGGVPFCWHCGRQLMRKKGGFYFALVGDPAGHEHRVHKDCLRLVLGDGIREIGGNYATRKVGAGRTADELHNVEVQGQDEAQLRTVPLERPVGRKG